MSHRPPPRFDLPDPTPPPPKDEVPLPPPPRPMDRPFPNGPLADALVELGLCDSGGQEKAELLYDWLWDHGYAIIRKSKALL